MVREKCLKGNYVTSAKLTFELVIVISGKWQLIISE